MRCTCSLYRDVRPLRGKADICPYNPNSGYLTLISHITITKDKHTAINTRQCRNKHLLCHLPSCNRHKQPWASCEVVEYVHVACCCHLLLLEARSARRWPARRKLSPGQELQVVRASARAVRGDQSGGDRPIWLEAHERASGLNRKHRDCIIDLQAMSAKSKTLFQALN
jgi:hypothetical protein